MPTKPFTQTGSNIHIPHVNIKRLRKLHGLKRYGINPVFLECDSNATVNTICNNIVNESRKSTFDPSVALDMIAKILQNHHYELNYMFYYAISQLSNQRVMRDLPMISVSLINLKNIVKRMIILHLKECNLIISNRKHKSLKYLNNELKKQHSCILCRRGTALFCMFCEYLSLKEDYEAKCNSVVVKEQFFWQRLDFINKKEFYYCPFHMNKKTDNTNIKVSYKLQRYQCDVNDFDMSSDMHMLNNFMFYCEDQFVRDCMRYLFQLLPLCAENRKWLKTFQVGKVIINVLTAWMKLLTKTIINSNRDQIISLANEASFC